MLKNGRRALLAAVWLSGTLCLGMARAAIPEDGPTVDSLQKIEAMHLADLSELRQISAKSPTFDATSISSNGDRQAMFVAVGRGDFPLVAAKASRILAGNLSDIDAHLMAGLAYEKLGEPGLAARHRAIGVGLLHSIMANKTGRSAGSAFEALSVTEEHSVLIALRLQEQRQALVREGDHSYDVIDAVDLKQAPVTIYFQVDQMLALETK